ncbi:uncharacterized protein LOC119672006 [Teleopsis dalmanni]|uniref:uncharacterized protein LOC119672006 n=1 Tax=Teleopsis dalmanni TaxID=139649 RepID=UPI0018CD61A5|nr:uncharacterized protein LOC119672006 [Teleopsis dalmanni]
MDCTPLNLAHFHERRANKFLKFHRYNEAYKAIETSLLYLHDAYKNVIYPKSIEVLDTQKWEYERKLKQIQMRKQQHDRLKLKEIVPPVSEGLGVLRPEPIQTAQSVAKSIDKTVQDFDAKFNNEVIKKQWKENQHYKMCMEDKTKNNVNTSNSKGQSNQTTCFEDETDIPSLAPLELPIFDTVDFNLFTSSNTSLSNIMNLVESFQK